MRREAQLRSMRRVDAVPDEFVDRPSGCAGQIAELLVRLRAELDLVSNDRRHRAISGAFMPTVPTSRSIASSRSTG